MGDDGSRFPMGTIVTTDEARRIAEEHARSVPHDIHVPTLVRMIEKCGVTILDETEPMASGSPKLATDGQAARS